MQEIVKEKATALLLLKSGKLVKELFRLRIEKQGILHGHAMILHVLSANSTLSQVQLARILNIKAASVSTILQSMKKEDLIERVPDKGDDRIMLTSLSAKGKKQADLVEKTWFDIEAETQKLFTEEEYKQLRYLCTKIIQANNNINDKIKEI